MTPTVRQQTAEPLVSSLCSVGPAVRLSMCGSSRKRVLLHLTSRISLPTRAGATVPPVWTSWLRGTRHHPPTPEELQKYAFEQQQLRLKVEALKLEERKRALLVKAEAARKQEQEQAVSEIER